MNNSKEREREELHKTIWKIANELRGSVDGWDFKQYVLGLLFYRFISENIENYVNENQRKAGIKDFKYRNISDEEALLGKTQILEEKGLFILPSELFCNVRKNADKNENLNVVISNIFNNIESSARGTASEDDVKGLFDDFTIDNKLGNTVDERNEKLVKLLNAIGNLNFGDYEDNNIDLFGDAYEYLMTMYASAAGKSGGEYFTPQEVGELLARIVIMDKTSVNKVYDPACGSGGLLLKFAKILGKENVREGFFGQEKNLTTYNLARINMFLHNINYNNFSIAREDTLLHPCHWDDEPFDAIVSNPPYSTKWVGNDNPLLINDERFAPAGVLAPKNASDLAFVMHMLSWLSPAGTAAIVEYTGVLHRPGAEKKIRKYLIENNFIDAIIKMPNDLFYGTSTETCIIVLKKSKKNSDILFIDASNEFIHPGNKNQLSDKNIENILSAYKKRENINKKSIVVSCDDIVNYNLSVNKYLQVKKEEKKLDINKHTATLEEIVKRENKIRIELNNKLKQIDKLINDLKNNTEVEYIPLGTVLDYIQPGPYIVKSTEYNDNYKYPVLTAGLTFILGYTNEEDGHYMASKDNPVIIFDDFTTSSHWVDFEFKVKSSAMKMLVPKNNDDNFKYIYYCMKNIKYVPQEHSRQWIQTYSKFEIPIPPKKLQYKIVETLNEFTKLEAELEAELEARKSQYEFWREKILKYGDDDE